MDAQGKARTSHKNEFVKATNIENGEVKFYRNGMDASREIGCSHVLAYKVLKDEVAMARGWRLEYIDKDDPKCATFKKEIEDRIQSQRQALLEHVQCGMRKRNEFVKGAKAQRKAEHDEIVRTLHGMIASLL